MAETILQRPKRYNETVCLCEQLVKHHSQNTVLLRPKNPIHSFERDIQKLTAAYQEGYQLAESRMDEIKALFA